MFGKSSRLLVSPLPSLPLDLVMQTTPVAGPTMTSNDSINGRWKDHRVKPRAMTTSGGSETGPNGKLETRQPNTLCLHRKLEY